MTTESTHTTSWQCQMCGDAFPTPEEADVHYDAVHGDKLPPVYWKYVSR